MSENYKLMKYMSKLEEADDINKLKTYIKKIKKYKTIQLGGDVKGSTERLQTHLQTPSKDGVEPSKVTPEQIIDTVKEKTKTISESANKEIEQLSSTLSTTIAELEQAHIAMMELDKQMKGTPLDDLLKQISELEIKGVDTTKSQEALKKANEYDSVPPQSVPSQ